MDALEFKMFSKLVIFMIITTGAVDNSEVIGIGSYEPLIIENDCLKSVYQFCSCNKSALSVPLKVYATCWDEGRCVPCSQDWIDPFNCNECPGNLCPVCPEKIFGLELSDKERDIPEILTGKQLQFLTSKETGFSHGAKSADGPKSNRNLFRSLLDFVHTLLKLVVSKIANILKGSMQNSERSSPVELFIAKLKHKQSKASEMIHDAKSTHVSRFSKSVESSILTSMSPKGTQMYPEDTKELSIPAEHLTAEFEHKESHASKVIHSEKSTHVSGFSDNVENSILISMPPQRAHIFTENVKIRDILQIPVEKLQKFKTSKEIGLTHGVKSVDGPKSNRNPTVEATHIKLAVEELPFKAPEGSKMKRDVKKMNVSEKVATYIFIQRPSQGDRLILRSNKTKRVKCSSLKFMSKEDTVEMIFPDENSTYGTGFYDSAESFILTSMPPETRQASTDINKVRDIREIPVEKQQKFETSKETGLTHGVKSADGTKSNWNLAGSIMEFVRTMMKFVSPKKDKEQATHDNPLLVELSLKTPEDSKMPHEEKTKNGSESSILISQTRPKDPDNDKKQSTPLELMAVDLKHKKSKEPEKNHEAMSRNVSRFNDIVQSFFLTLMPPEGTHLYPENSKVLSTPVELMTTQFELKESKSTEIIHDVNSKITSGFVGGVRSSILKAMPFQKAHMYRKYMKVRSPPVEPMVAALETQQAEMVHGAKSMQAPGFNKSSFSLPILPEGEPTDEMLKSSDFHQEENDTNELYHIDVVVTEKGSEGKNTNETEDLNDQDAQRNQTAVYLPTTYEPFVNDKAYKSGADIILPSAIWMLSMFLVIHGSYSIFLSHDKDVNTAIMLYIFVIYIAIILSLQMEMFLL